MNQLRLFSVAALAAVAIALLGCGGSDEKYYIPADHQIRPFVAPDADEIAGDEESEELDDDEGAGASSGAVGEGDSDAPATAAPSSGAAEPAMSGDTEGKAAKPGKSGKPASSAKPKAKSGSGSP